MPNLGIAAGTSSHHSEHQELEPAPRGLQPLGGEIKYIPLHVCMATKLDFLLRNSGAN